MNERGHTLVEMVIVLGLIVLMASVLIPGLRAYSQEAQLMGAAQTFCGQFREAYSMAVKQQTLGMLPRLLAWLPAVEA